MEILFDIAMGDGRKLFQVMAHELAHNMTWDLFMDPALSDADVRYVGALIGVSPAKLSGLNAREDTWERVGDCLALKWGALQQLLFYSAADPCTLEQSAAAAGLIGKRAADIPA